MATLIAPKDAIDEVFARLAECRGRVDFDGCGGRWHLAFSHEALDSVRDSLGSPVLPRVEASRARIMVEPPEEAPRAGRRAARRAIAVAAMVFSVLAAMPARASGLDEFVRAYHCPLLKAFETIRAHEMTPLDRYIALSVDRGQRYVQCRFFDQDRQIECEAASGFYGPQPAPKMSRARLNAIASQGFSMDGSQGNFRLVRPIADHTDLWAITDLVLETLYRGYGARLKRPLGMDAAFVPGKVLPRGDSSCVPVG